MRRLLRLAGACGGSHDAIEAIESSEAGTDGRRREIAMECANTYGSLGEHEEVPALSTPSDVHRAVLSIRN
jgi:hypothetical protein